MSIVAASILKSYFETGDKPTQAQFIDLIDSLVHQSVLSTLATLANPVFTGNPQAPTQSNSDNSQNLATTAYVKAVLSDLVASSPAALDTLNELAAALGNDADFATTVTTALGLKANSLDGVHTGITNIATAYIYALSIDRNSIVVSASDFNLNPSNYKTVTHIIQLNSSTIINLPDSSILSEINFVYHVKFISGGILKASGADMIIIDASTDNDHVNFSAGESAIVIWSQNQGKWVYF